MKAAVITARTKPPSRQATKTSPNQYAKVPTTCWLAYSLRDCITSPDPLRAFREHLSCRGWNAETRIDHHLTAQP